MERKTSDLKTQFTVDGAQAVIRAAVLADVATFAGPDERTDRIMKALAKADLIIVPKPRGDVEAVRQAVRTGDWSAVSERDLMAWREAPIPEAEVEPKPISKDPADVLRQMEAERQRAWELGLNPPAGSAARVGEARRTGDWSEVSDADWTAWVNVLRRSDPEPKLEAGRVVVLDEAGERKLQDLLAGRSVPTGRLVEVTYRMPDGSVKTQRHAEFGKLDTVSYDPLPPAGAEVEGADVLCARATLKLQPGKPASSAAFDRDVEVLGVFWADGVVSFSGEASQMVAFREMAAGVAGVSGSRMAFL